MLHLKWFLYPKYYDVTYRLGKKLLPVQVGLDPSQRTHTVSFSPLRAHSVGLQIYRAGVGKCPNVVFGKARAL